MNNRDYFIAFDESGQPYIAHAQVQTDLRPGSRSIAKLVEGSKVLRYFKDNAELQAYYKNAQGAVKGAFGKIKTGVNSAIDKVSSRDEKARLDEAKQNYENAMRRGSQFAGTKEAIELEKAQEAYDKATLKGRAKTALSTIKQYGGKTIGEISAAAGRAAGKVRDVADRIDSRDEKADLDAAKAEYEKWRGTDYELQAAAELDRAQRAYDRTYGATARRAAGRAGEAITGAAGRVADKARDVADRIDSRDEKARLDEAKQNYDNAMRRGSQFAGMREAVELEKAQEDYDRTYGATARRAAGRAGEAVSGAASRAGEAISGTASSAIERLRESAAAVADSTYAREAKAEYDRAVREYEKVQGTGSDVELQAYWDMMNAQNALDRARGLLGGRK